MGSTLHGHVSMMAFTLDMFDNHIGINIVIGRDTQISI